MMFRDTGSHLFHKFNMLYCPLYMTVMGKVTDRCWRTIQSGSSELSWLGTHEELVTDVLRSAVEAQVSLRKQRVNNVDNCHVATRTMVALRKHIASIRQPREHSNPAYQWLRKELSAPGIWEAQ